MRNLVAAGLPALWINNNRERRANSWKTFLSYTRIEPLPFCHEPLWLFEHIFPTAA
jgi:hypothetical protein